MRDDTIICASCGAAHPNIAIFDLKNLPKCKGCGSVGLYPKGTLERKGDYEEARERLRKS